MIEALPFEVMTSRVTAENSTPTRTETGLGREARLLVTLALLLAEPAASTAFPLFPRHLRKNTICWAGGRGPRHFGRRTCSRANLEHCNDVVAACGGERIRDEAGVLQAREGPVLTHTFVDIKSLAGLVFQSLVRLLQPAFDVTFPDQKLFMESVRVATRAVVFHELTVLGILGMEFNYGVAKDFPETGVDARNLIVRPARHAH